jgi:hypothetical protein
VCRLISTKHNELINPRVFKTASARLPVAENPFVGFNDSPMRFRRSGPAGTSVQEDIGTTTVRVDPIRESVTVNVYELRVRHCLSGRRQLFRRRED